MLTNVKTPYRVVLKPGIYQSSDTKGGLNLNKWIPKFLKRIMFADTVDCCTYYPRLPVLIVANSTSPTDDETANVPVYGQFLAVDSNTDVWYWYIKNPDGTLDQIGTND